jgi:hypothetical protein
MLSHNIFFKKDNNRSKQPVSHPHLPPLALLVNIDRRGGLFKACPYPESWIWAAAEVAGGAVPHFLKNDSHLPLAPGGPPCQY